MDYRKLWINVFVLVLLTVGGAQAGTLTAEPNLIEFGTLREGPPVKKMVTLTNHGGTPVMISNVTTSCSCTTTVLEKNSLQPGESAGLEITYNTYKFPGKFQKYVNVSWGNEEAEKAVITMVGMVDPIPMGVLEADPRKVTSGSMAPEKPVKVQFSLRNTGNAEMTVTKIMSRNTGEVFFDSETNGPMKIKPGANRNVSITVTAHTPGEFLDLILVYSDARNATERGYKVMVMGTAK